MLNPMPIHVRFVVGRVVLWYWNKFFSDHFSLLLSVAYYTHSSSN